MSALALLRQRITDKRDLVRNGTDMIAMIAVGQRQAYDEVLQWIDEIQQKEIESRADSTLASCSCNNIVKIEPLSPTQIVVYNRDKSWYDVREGRDLTIAQGFLGKRPWAYFYATKANGQIVLWEEAPDQTW